MTQGNSGIHEKIVKLVIALCGIVLLLAGCSRSDKSESQQSPPVKEKATSPVESLQEEGSHQDVINETILPGGERNTSPEESLNENTLESTAPTDMGATADTGSVSKKTSETVTLQMKSSHNSTQDVEEAAIDAETKKREDLLSHLSAGLQTPEDFKIGPLQAMDVEGESQEVLQTIIHFFSSLSKETIDVSRLHPEWAEMIKQELQFHLEKGRVPIDVRIGRIEISEEARANIRLYGKKGRSEGEIFLAPYEGAWYITDIQADFSLLDIEYTSDEERFEPLSYRWLEIY